MEKQNDLSGVADSTYKLELALLRASCEAAIERNDLELAKKLFDRIWLIMEQNGKQFGTSLGIPDDDLELCGNAIGGVAGVVPTDNLFDIVPPPNDMAIYDDAKKPVKDLTVHGGRFSVEVITVVDNQLKIGWFDFKENRWVVDGEVHKWMYPPNEMRLYLK